METHTHTHTHPHTSNHIRIHQHNEIIIKQLEHSSISIVSKILIYSRCNIKKGEGVKRIVSGIMLALIMLSTLTLALNIQHAKSQQSTTLKIVDAATGSSSITIGSETEPIPKGGIPFAIKVVLEGSVSNLMTYQVGIIFDPTAINCTNAYNPKNDPNYIFYGKDLVEAKYIENTRGEAVIGAALLNPADAVTIEGGILCMINFTALKTGTFTLSFETTTDTFLLNNQCLDIPFQIQGFTLTVYGFTAHKPQIIIATVDVQPQALNLKSRGKWVTVYIKLPEGYNVADINRRTILLNGTIPVDPFWISKPIKSVIGDYDNDTIPDLMVKFDRQQIINYIMANVDLSRLYEERFMTITLTVTGKLNDGTPFQGSDTIKIILPMPRCWRLLAKLGIYPL